MQSRPPAMHLHENPWAGIWLFAAGLLLVEISERALPLPVLVPIGLLLGLLAVVGYETYVAGPTWGSLVAACLALYTLHFTSRTTFGVDVTPAGLSAGLTVLLVAMTVVGSANFVRSRALQFRHELEDRARELEARNEELALANSALEGFGSVVSHDLKEPVRGIENYLAAAQEEFGTPEGKRYLEAARVANSRLAKLMEGLLLYNRTAQAEVRLHEVEIASILSGDLCYPIYEQALRERHGYLTVDPDLPPVEGDTFLLSQLLGNVILNALRHNPGAQPRIVIEVVAEPSVPGSTSATMPGPQAQAHLRVRDNGPGFPEIILQKLRTDTPVMAPIRGGFGLLIAARAARRMGGRLWLENAEGGGGEVHIELRHATTVRSPSESPTRRDEGIRPAPAARAATPSARSGRDSTPSG
ncbi:MAG: sensor histidine kinase [Thermoplasmatota archaeon]